MSPIKVSQDSGWIFLDTLGSLTNHIIKIKLKFLISHSFLSKISEIDLFVYSDSFVIANHISLVNVQTNYCNNNLLILDVKQLNKIMKLYYFYTLKALWNGQGKIKIIMGCPGLKSAIGKKVYLEIFLKRCKNRDIFYKLGDWEIRTKNRNLLIKSRELEQTRPTSLKTCMNFCCLNTAILNQKAIFSI